MSRSMQASSREDFIVFLIAVNCKKEARRLINSRR
jgi:hypothetical protein